MTIEMHTGQDTKKKTRLGIFLMMLGLAIYPLSDAIIKHLMEIYSVSQATFLRAFARVIPLLLATYFVGGPRSVLKMKQPFFHFMRLGVSVVFTYIFMYAYSQQSLTVVYTLSYTSPFFLVLLGGLLLKEKISWERWMAVGMGAVGVVIALRPSFSGIEWISLLVLFGVFLGTLNKILMRKLAQTEHSLAIAIYPNLALIGLTFPYLMQHWQSMPWEHWALFGVVGLLSGAGQLAIVHSLRHAEASILAPIDNSTLCWVVCLDFFFWNILPDRSTILGVVMIVVSHLYLLSTTASSKALSEANRKN